MNESTPITDVSPNKALPRSVKVVGVASLLNDTASEMICPLLPHFLLRVLGGNSFYLGVIEGIAEGQQNDFGTMGQTFGARKREGHPSPLKDGFRPELPAENWTLSA